jgi:glyoxalase family protein
MGSVGAHAELHVTVEPHLPIAHPGAGGAHHVAFRTPDPAQYVEWEKHLNEMGIRHSGQVDRYYFRSLYFRSLYFREPNGILFEIATDGPGFGVDEDMETLGEKVALPPFLERRREEIVANLAPID